LAELSGEFWEELELWSAVDGLLWSAFSEKQITTDRSNDEKNLIFIGKPRLTIDRYLKRLDDHLSVK